MSHGINGRCPECGSGWLAVRIKCGFHCRKCHATFNEPMGYPKAEAKKKAAPNVVTPITYRQQLARQILAANEAARANVAKKAQKGVYFGKR